MTADSTSVALYRKYRPTKLSKLVGQESAYLILRNSLMQDKINHTYLFHGPRGCGKTSAARIFAKAINCLNPQDFEPCGECASCKAINSGVSYDVIEIDAASNTGVDNIRGLIQEASLASVGKKKVYIIDEAHMLTKAACNALLKTLEDTPEHVVFILATTDPQSLLETVRSRSLKVSFKLINPVKIKEHLARVAKHAELNATDEQLVAATSIAKGSLRDALTALQGILAGADYSSTANSDSILNSLASYNISEVFKEVAKAVLEGQNSRNLAESLLEGLRELFLLQMGAESLLTILVSEEKKNLAEKLGPKKIVQAIELLGEAVASMRSEYDHRVNLEIALARFCKIAA